ncbi:50S ribosomal protein L17 [Patescibacteria group bacterium]|nr:50S ribosomal protein L17 [Patescibacteria group bacterium]
MRHRNTVKTLKRSTSARKALLRDLATALFVHEKITTTASKAKVLRPFAERLITRAKKGDLSARRRLMRVFTTEQPVNKMLDVIGPRYKDRDGGYTRIIKLGTRQGDGAETVQIELV